ncbi:hypothetical protein NEMBOFW57_005584 [Staphylotrichum longicolle]|uniref:Aminoglycoside phosphotransferase domain-containing protein n=1 Tax=Staphylotrichum longicolle TaxID=669026 RepID=A0AAD4EY02_9PEZI|nr:hypothetical protein NEMBOFW57_005584 [Staphylotrichum longicolle]
MSPDPTRPWFKITGIVGDAITFDVPVRSHRDYLRIKVEDKLRQLQTTDIFLPNRYLSPLLTAFVSDTLPTLKLANEAAEFVFTHFDLSPRNVLVSGTPPMVTGLVDFEFSGFFPKVDEFVNDYVDNGGDWASAAYSAYLGRLAELGVDTPAHGIDEVVWRQAYWFGQMTEHIAPWWLPGDEGEEGLKAALRESAAVVQEMLRNFEKVN